MTRISPQTVPNPNNTSDHHVPETLISLTTPVTVPPLHGKADLEVTYTPDRLLITPDAFTAWINELISHGNSQTWEELAGLLVDSFYDTLLPVHVAIAFHIEGKVNHSIEMVKQQPQA